MRTITTISNGDITVEVPSELRLCDEAILTIERAWRHVTEYHFMAWLYFDHNSWFAMTKREIEDAYWRILIMPSDLGR